MRFMRRLIDLSKRAIERVNPKIAAGVGGALVVIVGVWLAFGRGRSTTQGPTRQVATGVGQPAPGSTAVQPAIANLADDQLPGTSGGRNHRLTQYGQPDSPTTALQPAANPYLPTSSDPAGGYTEGRTPRSQYATSGSPSGQAAAGSNAAAG